MTHLKGRMRQLLAAAAALLLLSTGLAVLSGSDRRAGAIPRSQNVALVNNARGTGNGGGNGGELPTSPHTDLGGGDWTGWKDAGFAPTFTDVANTAILDPNGADPLPPFDTVVLFQICDIGVHLAVPVYRARLEAFVSNGGKLIIWDSECEETDYSQFVFPFTTSNPGAAGATGTLTIFEGSTLGSADPASPHFLDVDSISNDTDAVGDANVFVTFDGGWCVSKRATNVLGVNGPVHTYASLGRGLILYVGLDADDLDDGQKIDNAPGDGEENLGYFWELMLRQPWDPAGLPCSQSASGVTLSPATARVRPGTAQPFVVTLRFASGAPVPDVEVTLTVISGPNAGLVLTARSDANGEARFSYIGRATEGVDVVRAAAAFSEPPPRQVIVDSVQAAETAPVRTSNLASIVWTFDNVRAPGYVMVAADDGWFAFGGLGFFGTADFTGPGLDRAPRGTILTKRIVGGAMTPSQQGYVATAADGSTFAHGDAVYRGGANNLRLRSPIVGVATTATGQGYWLAAADGGVFAYGDAVFYGSAAGTRLNAPIVAITRSFGGNGYLLASADGGVFAFGDAPFQGSFGGMRLRAPITGIASSALGGYWLSARDGGVFAFGNASFFGSAAVLRLTSPIVGITGTPTGVGYTLAAADGAAFAYGDSRFAGNLLGIRPRLRGPIVGITS